jgi:hypothetical protein
MLTQDELKSHLHYDQDTGIFTRLVSNNNKFRIGDIAGYLNDSGYISINYKYYLSHRLAWLYIHGEFPVNEIDHINGIKNDNRIENLRKATKAQNQMNKPAPKTNTSNFKGVSWHKRIGKWFASASKYNKKISLGYYLTAEEASIAYKNFTKQNHREFYHE